MAALLLNQFSCYNYKNPTYGHMLGATRQANWKQTQYWQSVGNTPAWLDVDIYARYQFRHVQIMRIMDPDLEHQTDHNGALSPSVQICLALKYFAAGTMQNVVRDTTQVHKSTVCRAIGRVSLALQRCQTNVANYVQLPSGSRLWPDSQMCWDALKEPISKWKPPAASRMHMYRKGFHSMNAQLVCDHDLHVTNCLIRWPCFIQCQSSLRADFEEGNSGYPLRKWLMTPLVQSVSDAEKRYSAAHTTTRNAMGWPAKSLAILILLVESTTKVENHK